MTIAMTVGATRIQLLQQHSLDALGGVSPLTGESRPAGAGPAAQQECSP
jgi:hypothetical protein